MSQLGKNIVTHMPKVPRWDGSRPPVLSPTAQQALRIELDQQLAGVMGDLTTALRSMVPTVLGSETLVLDANGTASRSYRLPFRSITVTSFSAQKLTVAPSPLQGAAPTLGPGVAIIAPTGYRVCNFSSYVWSIYGGTAGDQVVVEAFAQPQPPAVGR